MKKMNHNRRNSLVDAFTETKVKHKLVNDVLFYYNLLYKDNEENLAEELDQLAKRDFNKWKIQGYPLSTTAYNALQAGNITNTSTTLQTSNAIAPTSQTKLEDNACLSWRQSKQDDTLYPILENDRKYTDWIVKIKR